MVYHESVGANAPYGERDTLMEISSATSSLYSTITSQSAQERKRQIEQELLAQQTQPVSQPQVTSVSETQTAQAVDQTGASSSLQPQAERNPPVVNTSGQLVGTTVNTTA